MRHPYRAERTGTQPGISLQIERAEGGEVTRKTVIRRFDFPGNRPLSSKRPVLVTLLAAQQLLQRPCQLCTAC